MSAFERTPWIETRSLMRSAEAGGGAAERPAKSTDGSTARMRKRVIACMAKALERQYVEEKAREPAGLLVLGDRAAAAVFDPRIGELDRLDRVARGELDRVHDAGEADEFRALVDADLLLAAHEEIAVREHFGDRHRDRSGEVVRVVALAFAVQ